MYRCCSQAKGLVTATTRLDAVEKGSLEFTAKIENNKESVVGLTTKLEAQADEIAALKATVAKLMSALATAAGASAPGTGTGKAFCRGGASLCKAAVESDGESVVVSSPGTVQINTGRCGVVDLCAVDALVRSLQAALDVE